METTHATDQQNATLCPGPEKSSHRVSQAVFRRRTHLHLPALLPSLDRIGSEAGSSDDIGGPCYVGWHPLKGCEALPARHTTVMQCGVSQKELQCSLLYPLALRPNMLAFEAKLQDVRIIAIYDDFEVIVSRIPVLDAVIFADAILPAVRGHQRSPRVRSAAQKHHQTSLSLRATFCIAARDLVFKVTPWEPLCLGTGN